MGSPVSGRALGECNAITSPGFGPSGLTFVRTLETTFGAICAPRAAPESLQTRITNEVMIVENKLKMQCRAETDGFLQANGSGVVVDPNGFIVTNFHVIEGAQRIQVTLDKNALSTIVRRGQAQTFLKRLWLVAYLKRMSQS